MLGEGNCEIGWCRSRSVCSTELPEGSSTSVAFIGTYPANELRTASIPSERSVSWWTEKRHEALLTTTEWMSYKQCTYKQLCERTSTELVFLARSPSLFIIRCKPRIPNKDENQLQTELHIFFREGLHCLKQFIKMQGTIVGFPLPLFGPFYP